MLPSFLTAFFWAFSIIFAARATILIGGVRAHFFRLLAALACLAVYAHTWGQGLEGPGMTFFVLGGILGIALGDLSTFQALRYIGPQLAVLLVQCLCAPFAAAIEWAWLGTTLTGRQMTGCGVILLGTAISLWPGVRPSGARKAILLGGGLAALASFLQAVGAVFTRYAVLMNRDADVVIDGMTAAYQRVLGAAVMMIPIYFLVRHFFLRRESPGTLWRAWPWVLANGLAGMVFGVGCFQWALATAPAAIVLSIVALTPLIVLPIVWIIDKKRPHPLVIVGSVLAVAGILLLT